MDDILKEFLVESHEHLDAMERDLVALEQNPSDEEALARVFRAAHTIKGTCGFFGLPRLESLAHAGENVLTKLLGGELRFGTAVAGGLLRFVDAVRGILAEIERTGGEGEPDVAALVADLERIGAAGPQVPAPSAPAPGPAGQETPPAPLTSQTIRLDVELLNRLMNLVGELVFARNQILEHAGRRAERGLSLAAQHLNRVTSELQDSVMQARMEPVGRIWGKFPRVVRDLGVLFGKQVGIEMRGGETELDRTILEAIGDPLTHLVRNSLDHGLERPAVRRAAGKPEEGRLFLGAFQQGGHVVLEIRDDGAGIDPEAIRRHAVTRGLCRREEADALTDREAIELIFRPGFSTAAEVTNVSGRGVGMDVVRTNVERVGGTVDVESVPGQGTTFRILLPLTLAIIPGVVVETAGQRFVLPQAFLRELVLLQERESAVRVARVHDAPVCHLRGRLLPLVFLDEQLGLRAADAPPAAGSMSIAVLELEGRRYGLVVDRILDTQETVVKPLGRPLDRVPVWSGATILGDGSLALILDVPALAARAGLAEEGALPVWTEEEPGPAGPPTEAFLFCQGPDDGRALLRLGSVARLEEFPAASLEWAGEREVVQYGDRILPLVRIAHVLDERRTERRHPDVLDTEEERQVVQVAVCTRGARSVGLVVGRILDILDLVPDVQEPGSRAGVKGTMVVDGRVAEYLDADYLVRAADPEFFADG